jgi:hypothetical protein
VLTSYGVSLKLACHQSARPSREKVLKLGFGGLDDFVVHRFDQSVE